MAGLEYTLTGFDDFLERRSVLFVEALPSTRVCGVCGVVPSRSLLLPCGHVLCKSCKGQIANGNQKCPMDGREFSDDGVVSMQFKQSDLEQHRVFCVAGGRDCDFAGRLGDLKDHLIGCGNDKVRCPKCQVSVIRSTAVGHYRQCAAGTAVGQTVSAAAIASAVERLGSMRKDLENIRERASCDEVNQDPFVNDANSLAERMTSLERDFILMRQAASGDECGFLLPAVKKTVIVAGPYGAVSKPGVFITTCKFAAIYAGYKTLTGNKKEHILSTDTHMLAGYAFKLQCELLKEENGDAVVTFILLLRDGDWDDSVELPFSKNATIILAHPRDERKDEKMPVNMQDPGMVKKPAPGSWNAGVRTEARAWEGIELQGFIDNDTLYVNVEFE